MIPSSKPRTRWQPALAGVWCAAALAVLAACGGGTSQYESFQPKRVLAFGDETSVITSDGRKYGVNGINSTTNAIDCTLEPLWVQSVAALYGFVFAECNPLGVAEPQARLFAAPGAKVADLTAQVDLQVAAGGFSGTDLVLVMAGVNDILDLYRQFPQRSEAALVEDARTRGRNLAELVNRLVGLGARVIVSNLPEMSLSPYAQAEKAAFQDTDRAALIGRLVNTFNEQLGVSVLLDGRYVGLMQTDLRTQQAGRFPTSLGLSSATTAVCTAELPDCSSATLLPSAVASEYLWADATRLAPGGQAILAQLALDRAQRNPF